MTGSDSGRISVKEASEILGIPVFTLRYWVQTKKINIGHYIPSASGRYGHYIIYRELVDKWKSEGNKYE